MKLLTFAAIMLAFLAASVSVADDLKSVKTQQASTTAGSIESKNSQGEAPKPRRTRVLVILRNDDEHCAEEIEKLNKSGGTFEVLKSAGWKIGDQSQSHIQIVDESAFPEVVEQFKLPEFPLVACISDGEIVRSFKDGCSTPLDVWTFGWLLKGESERPKSSIPETVRVETTGNYRLRGNHWTVEGNPNPPKEVVVSHLRGPNHGHASGSYGAIDGWSYEELRSLHDDLHEREGGTIGNFAPAYSNQPPAANRSLDAFAGNRKALGR
jgi:hypothetical protein